MDRVPLVIYHGGCDDGFGAAWTIWALNADWEFYPGVHGIGPPAVLGREVYLVDFSYSREVLEQMAREAARITVIDHHDTAERALSAPFEGPDMCPVEVVFDQRHCGAVLTWRYFYPGDRPPPLLRHIEDRDLWTKKLPGCDEVIFALRSWPREFETWTWLMKVHIDAMRSDGEPILRWFLQQVNQQIERWLHASTWAVIGGYRVPVMNASVQFCSELAEGLARASEAPFGAVFWHTSQGVTYSLRSRGGLEVNRVAEQYGGGGHPGAAGFQVEKPLPMEVGAVGEMFR